jgi:ABC-type glutathione transport system ATPase component
MLFLQRLVDLAATNPKIAPVLDQHPQPMVEARGLRKTYAGRRGDTAFTAVHGIDFSVLPGETFGFLGPNGGTATSGSSCYLAPLKIR